MKKEKHRQRETAARRPQWAMEKAFEPPKTTDSGYGGRIAAKFGGGGGGGRADGKSPSKKLRWQEKTLYPSWEDEGERAHGNSASSNSRFLTLDSPSRS